LNGNLHLITGNHDRKEVTNNPRWSNVAPYHEIKIDFGDKHKQRICMCHYSMRTWNQMARGSWMLYGHSHGNLPDIGGKTMDVGVDAVGHRLIDIHEIKDIMDKREIINAGDHHDR